MTKNTEEKLLDDYPSYVTIEQTKDIIEQLEKGICKIFMDGGGKGTGFFCYIKKENSNISLPVLITNNHVLKEEAIKPDKIIKIAIYESETKQLKYKDIEIGNNRIVYTSTKYDTTIIEIKKEKDGINYFLDLDQRIFQDNSNVIYYGTTIYILHNPGNKSPSVSYSVLNKNKNSDYENIHFCCTESGSSGGPILSLSGMKVFGMHKGAFEHLDMNKGLFLKNPIEEFLSQSKKKVSLKNEIIITISCLLDEKNYFLDNTENIILGKVSEKLSHIYLKELNEFNTKLFIDEKEYKYKKYFKPNKKIIHSIKLKFNTQIKDCSHMFDGCRGIISIDLSSFDSSKVTNMSYMFNSCTKLSSINLNNFNTNLVTDMSHMFDNCGLEKLDLSSFDTSKVTNMSYMFNSCNKLSSINLNNFNTNFVTYISHMFDGCQGIISIDLSSFDTSKVTNMSYMFNSCNKLSSINLYNFNTNLVTDMSHMFKNCGLEIINLSSFNTSRVVDMSFMFSNSSIKSLDLSSFDTSNVKYMTYMFADCPFLKFIDLSKLNTKNLENKTYMFSKGIEKIKVNKKFIYDSEKLVENKIKKNYYLINSIICKCNPSEKFPYGNLKRFQREVDNCLFDHGFQIFCLKDDTLFGAIEGPILTPYQNGFFLFKMVYGLNYPFNPPKFIFITQMFHPNIDKEGNVSVDFLEKNNYTPALGLRTTILSVQSLLSTPNSEDFVNQEAASLYELSKEVYDETVKEYVNNYASYEIYNKKVKELNIENIISISD